MSTRLPRVLALLGSGETAPTMVTTHRDVVARLGRASGAVLLDTPYGFQENAAEISQRAVEYFAQRVQLGIEPAGYPGPLAADATLRTPRAEAAALARLRTASLVFAGPGSPSYALSVWRSSPVPEALSSKLAQGGAVVFASAAALTLGRFTVPVYEIYKVGQTIHWLDGLDLLAQVGFQGSCVLIPHFDNAEGGTHDTRFCYLGERRLTAMETMLPTDAWVLGIDEHTAMIVDLDSREIVVTGRGVVTVRRRGDTRRFPSLAAREGPAEAATDVEHTSTVAPAAGRSPLLSEVTRLERVFEAALTSRRADDAAEAIRELDRTIIEWSADSLQTDDPDRARAVLHSLIHRLGEVAAVGLRDPREVLQPLVEGLITLRAELRSAQAWAVADQLRARLSAARIELRDTPQGTSWDLR